MPVFQAMEHLEALRRRSAELAARVDPHLGRLTELKIEAKKRVDETEKTDANRAAPSESARVVASWMY